MNKTKQDLQEQIAQTINKETGANVEVTILPYKPNKEVLIYTEDVDKEEAILALMEETRSVGLMETVRYSAEEDPDFPLAGITVRYLIF